MKIKVIVALDEGVIAAFLIEDDSIKRGVVWKDDYENLLKDKTPCLENVHIRQLNPKNQEEANVFFKNMIEDGFVEIPVNKIHSVGLVFDKSDNHAL